MRTLLLVSALVAACFASTLEIISSPANLKFPDSSATLKTTQLSSLNEYILGLSARPVEGFNVEVDLFSRPRALAVIEVAGVDSSLDLGQSYSIEANGVESVGIEQELALVFGADRQSVQVTSGGITGSQLALSAQQQTVDSSVIKTKLPQLLSELEAVYQLAAAIKAAGAKTDNTADVFRVTISGLVGLNDAAEETVALNDIKNAVTALNTAIVNAYGNQAVVELLTVSSTLETVDAQPLPAHHISKREATAQSMFAQPRVAYGCTIPVSSDYPAIFAIFLGLVVILVVALIYIVVGMLSMDPGKDSIIYRMTTTRMKKD